MATSPRGAAPPRGTVPPRGQARHESVRATARLQFHRGFTLDDACAIVPYLHRLGISHVYASPLLTARPGSTHGYDIVDHNRINPELGGEPALRRLVELLRARRMGLILDIVPNHMGVGDDNAWWLDVLEWGHASAYADFFDIDWEPADRWLRGRLLAPFLGRGYGECLTEGELTLRLDATTGRLHVAYFDNCFPIAPADYAAVLRGGGAPLEPAAAACAAALAAQGGREAGGREAVRRAFASARASLCDEALQPAIAQALAPYAPTTPAGQQRLHRLLERQAYRLVWWRAAADDINWRRFFDINSLAGLRVELAPVFDATHAYVLKLYAEGLIDGVRVDHIDGLADPRGYGRKLRRRLASAARHRPAAAPSGPAIVWVEKILAPDEQLPEAWLTDGTTGYDFMDQVSALLHDPAGAAPLAETWATLSGRPADFAAEAEPARRQILREALSSEVFAAAAALHRLARRDLATRDYTLTAVRRALVEVLVNFRVYRIYAGRAGMSDADAVVLAQAMAGARRSIRSADRDLLSLLGGWLGGPGLHGVPAGPRRAERLRAMVRFQQLSAPATAKSVEDTAFYRYGRLLSRNEVGSDPAQFALAPAAFHAAAAARLAMPRALLATATHDHKRGEDSRARLAVLSEMPDAWDASLRRWTARMAALKPLVEGVPAPDAADEIMLYETLLGAWPNDLLPQALAPDGLAAFAARVAAWQEKALREAKRHSEWAAPNAAYEAACREFLAILLDPAHPAGMAHELATLAARLAPRGALNSLAQTVLRLTCPGIPDLYQGGEFWDLSLVDPDNRREVDFAARAEALDAEVAPGALLAHWRDGRIKLAVLARLLALRARLPELFAHGQYQPLAIEGAYPGRALAFLRQHQGSRLLVVVSRLAAPAAGTESRPLITPGAWEDTRLIPPAGRALGKMEDVLGSTGKSDGDPLRLGTLLFRLPVAVLLGA